MFAPSWLSGAGTPDDAIALVRESLTRIRELHDKFAFVYALVPLAAAAALKGDDAWAARILGARDTVTERTGATVVDKSVHDLREHAEREARARLGPDRGPGVPGRAQHLDRFLAEGHRSSDGSGTPLNSGPPQGGARFKDSKEPLEYPAGKHGKQKRLSDVDPEPRVRP